MIIAVTDACIFIDLIELRLLSQFFGLQLQVLTSRDVYNELYPKQQDLLAAYMLVGKLTVYNILPEERKLITMGQYPKSLSDSDKTVIYLAKKNNATVISSDKAVRNYSKLNSIPYHGMLWIFDRLIESNIISSSIAVAKIKDLVSGNIVYQNNNELTSEIEKRIQLWSQ
jgi:hypothetical protein